MKILEVLMCALSIKYTDVMDLPPKKDKTYS